MKRDQEQAEEPRQSQESTPEDPELSREEEEDVGESQLPRAVVLHEIIRTQGDHELGSGQSRRCSGRHWPPV